MPQDIPATCDGCGKRFSIEHALSFPKGGLVLARPDDNAKEWGTIGSRSLDPSDTSYKQKISGGTVQEERTGEGSRQDSGTADGGAVILVQSQRVVLVERH